MRKNKTMGGGERPESYWSGNGGGSELFISFAARSTSAAAAAMRVTSSKSLLSPGRGRDPAAPSLSASLSKRLRSSGSLKGGQSPMFPAVAAGGGGGGRRKGCALEAVEPSSPKVTCIGQVRVKSKKKKAKAKAAAMARSRSKRGSGKEASFRRTEEECWPRKNQRWVYQLPVSICEGLRAFGTEFNCFLPCGSSPCSSSGTGEEKRGKCEEKRNTSSCGHVLARWLMAMQEGEEQKRGEVVGLGVEERGKRELDLVMEEREKREVEGVEVGNGNGAEKKDEVLAVGDAEEARVSACIPPRNALLLMRCRSDPVRMAALANRFWGSPATKVEVEEEEEGEEADVEVGQHLFGLVEVDREKIGTERDEKEAIAAAKVGPETGEVYKEETQEERSSQGVILRVDLEEMGSSVEEKQQRSSEETQDGNENGGESLKEGPSADSVEVQRNPPRDVENAQSLEKSEETVLQEETHMLERGDEKKREEEKGRRSSDCSSSMGKEERRSHNHKCLSKAKEGGSRRNSSLRNKEKRRHSFSTARDARRHSFSHEREARRASFSIEGKRRWSFSIDKEEVIPEEENALHEEEEEKKEEDSFAKGEEARKAETLEKSNATEDEEIEEHGGGRKEEENGKVEEGIKVNAGKERRELPDCLLLMMYEPKLSMEVSKETWVCSTDFLRGRPHHHRHLPKGSGGDCGGCCGRGGGEGDGAKIEKVENGEDTEVTSPAEPAFLQAAPPPPPPVPPTASAIEQKLMSVAAPAGPKPPPPAYGPFLLTRCKSEPIRSSARLAPDACFWKDGHRPIGATGIGF
ncbi:enolase-phosphatase E1-like [Cocos nucifera]|uniref:Enolase-phosphatase E1-like n=1 Tax=Cocos nucifera TaxID=13894 RepID=A0A8K0HYG3_COCNU|nr:enolase-phosphatase E1-like [Cocos nucifera]